MLWFDTTIFILTLVQALRMRHMFPGRLLEIMFRDGMSHIYYPRVSAEQILTRPVADSFQEPCTMGEWNAVEAVIGPAS